MKYNEIPKNMRSTQARKHHTEIREIPRPWDEATLFAISDLCQSQDPNLFKNSIAIPIAEPIYLK